MTDLVGVRVLHLFKEDWKAIHEVVKSKWDFLETPKAYVRKGDPEAYLDAFRTANFEVVDHQYGYRSLHYLAKSQPQKTLVVVELQVRTIFEEGWSEVDHRVRYPSFSNNALLIEFLKMFNRLAGSADEMGSFVVALNRESLVKVGELAELRARLMDRTQQFEDAIGKLDISEKEKAELKKKLSEIATHKSTSISAGVGIPSVGPSVGPSILGLQKSFDSQSLLGAFGGLKLCSACGTPLVGGEINGKCIPCSMKGMGL